MAHSSRRRSIPFSLPLLACLSLPMIAEDAPIKEAARKIVLIAGSITGHPKDAHEYEKSVILLKTLLDSATNLRGIRTEAHFRGWPEDPTTLDDAATIVFITDGGDRREEDHPLYAGDRFQVIEKQMRRGCGLVNFHWSTFHPSRFHDTITEWVGGYFDYETGTGPRKWYSAITTKEWMTALASPEHPISHGVKPFRVNEEFYYRIRFRDGDPRLKPILTTGPGEGTETTVGWAVEREDGGRGFGFTGGHFYRNWWLPDFRRLILNAIVWTAGARVPRGGVESRFDDEPIRTLIVTGHNHPAHEWRSTTAALLAVLEQDPRVTVDVTEDPRDLASLPIKGYDAVVLNYCNWDRPGLSDAEKHGLLGYLRSGGGLSVIHFANGAFNYSLPESGDSDWEEYRAKIVRRAWIHGEGKSGHDPFGPFRVDLADARHPITAGLAPFETNDELYFRQEGPLPIEPLVTARSRVTGKDEPLAWAYTYASARVFQTVLGHAAESVRRAGALIRRGAVWTARRESLGFDPPVELTDGVLFRDGSKWSPELSKQRAEAREKAPGEAGSDAGDASPKKSSSASAAPSAPSGSARGTELAERGRGPVESVPASESERRAGESGDPGEILPANRGLDGGLGGHWGVVSEAEWTDRRWNQMDTGPFLSTSLETERGFVRKGIAIRLGEDRQASMCFDSENLGARAGWTDGFLRLGTRYFGLVEVPKIIGRPLFVLSDGAAWDAGTSRYNGLYLHGDRVVLSYSVDARDVAESPWAETLDGVTAITRTFRFGPADSAHRLRLVDPAGEDARVTVSGGVHVREAGGSGTVTALSVVGSRELALEADERAGVALLVPARRESLHGKLMIWSGDRDDLSTFARLVGRSARPEDLDVLMQPGEPNWPETLTTKGEVSQRRAPYVIDTITVPFDNPYKAVLFLTGHDFVGPHRAAVSTVYGDVWLVDGIDDDLDRITWKRYATGLYQPLGVKVEGGRVYVVGRDQITVLHDRDGDGEADHYENFSNAWETFWRPHHFTTCLETDPSGNFYTVSPAGAHRISRDGTGHEILATGWRNPNGLTVGPDGTITVSPQEGEWTPASQISEVRPGGYYGYPGPRVSDGRPLGYDPPLCWIPRHIDNSTGAQVWVTSDRWGPLEGQLLNLSYGQCSMQLVLRERVDGQPQGGVVPLRGRFRSGIMRGRFSSRDGQLYVTGMKGWVTSAVSDGAFQRVRYTGGRFYLPTGLNVHSNGLRLTFTEPLLRDVAEDVESYSIEQWNYRYRKEYGSEEYSVRSPGEIGHDPVSVRSATLLEDARSVFLEIPDIQPVMQMHIRVSLEAADGSDVAADVYNTINRLGPRYELDEARARVVRPEPEVDRGAPGLALTLRSLAASRTDTRVARLAALRVEEGTPPSPFLKPGPFSATWQGYLEMPARDRVTFSAEGRGRVRLSLDGEVVLQGAGEDLSRLSTTDTRLRKGRRAFKLEYTSPARGAAWLRLYWSGRDFARETLSPEVFRHDPAHPAILLGRRLREGRELMARHRCLKCHEPAGAFPLTETAMPELAIDAPSFVGIGSRLREEWMARWMIDPRGLRPTATMPDLLGHGAGAGGGAGDRDAWHIAAFLATLADESGGTGRDEKGSSDHDSLEAVFGMPDDARVGGQLFAELGCVACHTLPDDPRLDKRGGRIPLSDVVWKWKPGALEAFLEQPDRHYASTRMPDPGLSRREARALGAFLRETSIARPEFGAHPAGDASTGRDLMATLGCLNCHALPLENRFEAPTLARIAATADWRESGCVAEGPHRGPGPDLGLAANEKAAVREVAASALDSLGRRSLAEFAGRQVKALGCGGCHERDGQASAWSRLEKETDHLRSKEPSRITVETRPTLTFTGEQLRAPWLEKLLSGTLGYRLRPWLDARMPAFPAGSHLIARGLALDHGLPSLPDDGPLEPAEAGGGGDGASGRPPEKLASIGRQLLGRNGGFSCVTCHPVGDRNADMELHFGVTNLGYARERLRKEYYLRWMLGPQRIRPLSPMPAYTDAEGLSALPSVLGGEGARQFEAIWEFLGTLR